MAVPPSPSWGASGPLMTTSTVTLARIKGNKLNKRQERCSHNAANKDIGTVFKLQLQRRSHKAQVSEQQQQQTLQREISAAVSAMGH